MYMIKLVLIMFFVFQAADGIRDRTVTGVQTCALPISARAGAAAPRFGSQVWPFHRHNRSAETAAFHCEPSHHQKPSGENMVSWCGGGIWPGGSAPIS